MRELREGNNQMKHKIKNRKRILSKWFTATALSWLLIYSWPYFHHSYIWEMGRNSFSSRKKVIYLFRMNCVIFNLLWWILKKIFIFVLVFLRLAILQRDILSLICWLCRPVGALWGESHRNSPQILLHSQFQILSRRKNSLIW